VFKAGNLQHAATQGASRVIDKSAAAVRWIENQSKQKKSFIQLPARKPSAVTGIGANPSGGGIGTNLVSGRPIEDKVKAELNKMVLRFFEVDNLTQLGPLSSIVLPIVAKCAASAAPVIGHVKDGIGLFSDWTDAGLAYYRKKTISRRNYSIELGAPAAAFAALQDLLADEAKQAAIDAGISSTSFVVKTGLAFVDGGAFSGPITGTVAALAEVAHTLYLLGMEWRATRDANQALAAGKLDITLFETYPLMGCYLLRCATLSDIIPISCFGTPGWMDYFEKKKKGAIDDILKRSEALIDKSPWEIRDMPKRPVGSDGGLISEAVRYGEMVLPFGDLADLKDLGKTG
jgi:hypothetical protein